MDDTNREFRTFEVDPQRVFKIAITEHGLGINHRQSKESRICQTKEVGARGRRVVMHTSTGIKLGGGIVTGPRKYESLCKYEKDRYSKGIGFYPILHDSLEVDDEYKRFNNDMEGKDDEKEQKEDGRKAKRGKDKPLYIRAKVDIKKLFYHHLHELDFLALKKKKKNLFEVATTFIKPNFHSNFESDTPINSIRYQTRIYIHL